MVPRPGVAAVQLTRSEDTLARPRSTRRDTARLLSPRTCTEVTVRTVQRTVERTVQRTVFSSQQLSHQIYNIIISQDLRGAGK